MDILGYLPRSLDCHAQDVDEDDDESTSEAPDAGTTSDLEELDSSLSSTAPASTFPVQLVPQNLVRQGPRWIG